MYSGTLSGIFSWYKRINRKIPPLWYYYSQATTQHSNSNRTFSTWHYILLYLTKYYGKVEVFYSIYSTKSGTLNGIFHYFITSIFSYIRRIFHFVKFVIFGAPTFLVNLTLVNQVLSSSHFILGLYHHFCLVALYNSLPTYWQHYKIKSSI